MTALLELRVGARRHGVATVVGVLVAGVAGLVFWNVSRYTWVNGYDAWSIANYVDVVEHAHRLPTPAESDVWHNPPLFFVVAAVLQEIATAAGWREDPYKAVQIMSGLCVVALCLLAFLTARELWPTSKRAQVAAPLIAGTTPVVVRAGALYHPEALCALLSAGAVYVVVRAFSRGRLTVGSAVAAGLLLGLANLTRTWALAELAAVIAVLALALLWRRERELLRYAAVTVLVAGVVVAPWLVYKAVRYDSPLAYSQPNAEQWHGSRPLAFYTALDLGDVFSHPYWDHYRNHLLPVVYTDWWGDYWRYWRVPASMRYDPPVLPDRLDAELRLQSFVGILPSLLLLVGFVGVARGAVRSRSPALLLLVVSVLCLALSYVGFLVQYPKQDGDNMKALYVLNAAFPLALCAGLAVEWLSRANRLFLVGLALIAAELLYLDVRFLVLT